MQQMLSPLRSPVLRYQYIPYHTASVMPAVVLVATMSKLGHWLKSCMLENTQTVPSHIRPVRAEQARTKLPSARQERERVVRTAVIIYSYFSARKVLKL